MSICSISLDIIEYQPNTLNYDDYSFVFRSLTKDWEGEIKPKEKGIVTCTQKLQKEIKYTIKMAKNSALMGISDITIPSSITLKKEELYEQICTITMTESTKRQIFGNVQNLINNNIKLKIRATIQYNVSVDKSHVLKQSHSLPKSKMISSNSQNISKDKIEKEKDEVTKNNLAKSLNNNLANSVMNNNKKPGYNDIISRKQNTPSKLRGMKDKKLLSYNNNMNLNNNKNSNYNNYTLNPSSSYTIKNNSNINNNNPCCLRYNENQSTNGNKKSTNEKIVKNSSTNNSSKNIYNANKISKKNNSFNGVKNNQKNNNLNSSLDPSIDPNDISVIDDSLLKENDNNEDCNRNIADYYNNYIINNPLDDIINTNYVQSLKEKTKQLIQNIFNLQKIFYEKLNPCLVLRNNYRNLLNDYTNKYHNILKKKHKLEEMELSNQDKANNILNTKKNEINYIDTFIPLRKKENDICKLLIGIKDETCNDKNINMDSNNYTIEEVNNLKENENLLSRKLIYLLNQNSSILNFIKGKVSDEDINNAINKYNLPVISEKISNNNFDNYNNNYNYNNKNEIVNNNVSLEYVVIVGNNKIDENDIKLDNYLKYFYSKRKIPKIPFIKTSLSNYEYGTQKVMIKSEGEIFRIRFIGGYSLLDKFLEINSTAEDMKMKNKDMNKKKSKDFKKSKK